MSEKSMRALLVKKLKRLHGVAIESPMTGIGIPDVNCAAGWIECKWMKSWPKTAEIKPVKFAHELSKAQQIWLWKRELAGGVALVCAKVSDEWFFWSGRKIKEKELWNNMTRPQMRENAEITFKGKFPEKDLCDWLSQISQMEKHYASGENVKGRIRLRPPSL